MALSWRVGISDRVRRFRRKPHLECPLDDSLPRCAYHTTMHRAVDTFWSGTIKVLAALSLLALAFVVFFIVREALPLFDEVPLADFLLGTRWMPVDFGTGTSFGVFNFIAGTVAVSLLALALAVLVGLGAAMFLACAQNDLIRAVSYPFIDLLAGVPSVVYGFVGLLVVAQLFMAAGVSTGLCVMAAAIVLAVMILPFLISSCSESLLAQRSRFLLAAQTLGISRWGAMATIVLPAAMRNVLLSLALAIGRAMGETMAVMMVIGNANVFPTLLGKGETIPSAIALEMGTAVAGSLHYHALFAAGMVLMLLLLAINLLVSFLRNRLSQEGRLSLAIGGHGGRRAGAVARAWAVVGYALVVAVVLFLFGYVFWHGAHTISWEFLTQPPSGLVLGEEGGIAPAIAGSFAFTACAVVLGGVPAIACALYVSFYVRSKRMAGVIRLVVQCIAGIPSIILGLFAYSFLVRDLAWGRCVLSAGMALAVMVMPFMEVRAEKAFSELPQAVVNASYALGCSRFHAIRTIVLPACQGELVSGVILGACYALGATAPLLFTGGVAFAGMPTDVMEPAMALPLHLYLLVAQGATSLDTAFGTAFVMMALILTSNAVATAYARVTQKDWRR